MVNEIDKTMIFFSGKDFVFYIFTKTVIICHNSNGGYLWQKNYQLEI